MKILHLLSQRPDSTGSGFYVRAVMEEAAAAGHENFLVAGIADDCTGQTAPLPEKSCFFIRFGGMDLPFPIPGMSDVMPYESRRFMDLTARELALYKNCFTQTICRAVERIKPDIIHSNHLWVMTALARRECPDIPLVTTCHGTDLRQLRNCGHLRPWIVENCRSVDHVFALSRTQKIEIAERYQIPSEKITVAGSGFNDRLFSYGAKPAPPPVNLLYAGKLSRAKGVIWLLESIEKIMDLPFHLFLAGSGTGPEADQCRRLAERHRKKVTLCGALTQTELAGRMRQAHIFVLPSFFEGLPLVLFEALASGCKIIATPLDGTKEILQGAPDELAGFVWLPRLETVDAPFASDLPEMRNRLAAVLAHAIEKSMVSPAMDKAIARGITKPYTWQEVYTRLESVYLSLVPA